VKTWDVVIIGGGIIGLSLALSLRKHGTKVLVLDRSEPGREASHAAAGMLAACDPHIPEILRPLADSSGRLWPEFVHEIEDESGLHADYRENGTILYLNGEEEEPFSDGTRRLEAADVAELEPALSPPPAGAVLLPEASVDPRSLIAAAIRAAHHRGVDMSSGEQVTQVESSNLGVTGVSTPKTRFPAATVVNCAGAWACQVPGLPISIPTRPVKGHMLDVIPAARVAGALPGHVSAGTSHALLRHVVRTPDVYLVPRSAGRIVIGSTVEEAGYDKRVVPDVIQALHQRAANICPAIGEARMHEGWAGLRPGTPDNLPILGATFLPGYFVATGHFRDGILLAPITATIMTNVVRGATPEIDLAPFSPSRFHL
jgi:glycine oxidase